MQDKNISIDEGGSHKKFVNKVIGYALLTAGIGVLILTIIRGVDGYQNGLLSFTETEYLETVADVESGFLPLIELPDNKSLPEPDNSDEEDVIAPDDPETGDDTEEDIVDLVPVQITIGNIDLDVNIIAAEKIEVEIDDVEYLTWVAPDGAVGWQYTSAKLGEVGNTVLIGHHNIKGSVFKDLVDLEVGDIIVVSSVEGDYEYEIKETLILLEKGQELEVRLENAKWLWETIDERLTLVTCWPKYDNSHRLIIMAMPVK